MKAVDILDLIAKEEGVSTKYVVFPKKNSTKIIQTIYGLLNLYFI